MPWPPPTPAPSPHAEAPLSTLGLPAFVRCLCTQKRLGPGVGDVGFKQAMQQKWVGVDKSGGEPLVVRKVRQRKGLPVRAWSMLRVSMAHAESGHGPC